MNRLEVKASKLTLVVMLLLGLFLVPLGLLSVYGGLSRGVSPARVGVGLAVLAAYGAVLWLARRGHAMSVKHFSESGLVRNDGRSFAWGDLSRVVDQVRIRPRAGVKTLWRTEIQFRDGGAAWLIPSKVSNFEEVSRYVRALPCEHTEVGV